MNEIPKSHETVTNPSDEIDTSPEALRKQQAIDQLGESGNPVEPGQIIEEGPIEIAPNRSAEIDALGETVFKKMEIDTEALHDEPEDEHLPVSLWKNPDVTVESVEDDSWPEIKAGIDLTSEQAKGIGHSLAIKVSRLSTKPELSEQEKRLVGWVSSLSARNIVHMVDSFNYMIPQSTNDKLVKYALNWERKDKASPVDSPKSDDAKEVVAMIAGGQLSGIFEKPALRSSIEDFAINAAEAFGEIAEANDGIKIDSYIEDTLIALKNHLDKANKEQAQRDM